MKNKLGLSLIIFILLAIIGISDIKTEAQLGNEGLDFPFPSNEEWEVINGYNDGDLHGGQDGEYDYGYALYALDFAKADGETAGSPVFLPTDVYYYRIQAADPTCIDFGLQSIVPQPTKEDTESERRLFLEICHVDIDSRYSEPGIATYEFLPKGAYLGTVASDCKNCSTPHIHMAAHISPVGSPWTEVEFLDDGVERTPMAFQASREFDLDLADQSFPPIEDDTNQYADTAGLFSTQPSRDNSFWSGTFWQGTLSQDAGGITSSYAYTMRVSVSDRGIEGIATIIDSESSYFGELEFEGGILADGISFQDVNVTQNNLPDDYYWCLKSGNLTLSSDNQTISGAWEGNEGCPNGTVTLDMSFQPSLGGFWNGTMYQDAGGINSSYEYTMTINQTGSGVRGFATILDPSSDYFGELEFEGSVVANGLRFIDISVTNSNLPDDYYWCLKSGILTLSENDLTLSGAWDGNEGCSDGTVILERD